MFISEVSRTPELATAFFKAARLSRVVATGFSETMWMPFRAAANDASALR